MFPLFPKRSRNYSGAIHMSDLAEEGGAAAGIRPNKEEGGEEGKESCVHTARKKGYCEEEEETRGGINISEGDIRQLGADFTLH